MLIRSNGIYKSRFSWDRKGLLIILPKFIFATKAQAHAWA